MQAGRQLSAHHLQRERQLQQTEALRKLLTQELTGRRRLIVYLVSTPSHTLSPPLSCLVQEGDGIVCLGGTRKAYTVAQVVYDGDGSFVIEDAVNTAYCWLTAHQPLFHNNQLNSCLFVHLFLES